MDTSKLIDSMKRVVKSELGSYDTTATVKRVEGSTAWVHIPGGVDETPVRLTMNAKAGDSVQVRVSDGKAFLAGNVSAPPTDDTTAEAAKNLANRAAEDAGRAKSAADIAESYATSAQASAAQSATILDGMEAAATAAGTTLDGIYADAAAAKATTDEINTYATTAGKTVTQILEDGETAGAAAQAATEAANSALVGLSTVEDVVGVLNWISEHGTMTLTSDVTVNPAHVYFVVDPAGDYVVGGTHYSIVSEPDDADIGTYYELTVDESVQNYVVTHVAVDAEGLWLIPENNATPASSGKKILIATGAGSTYTTAGTYIIEKVGGTDTVLASFTASGAQIGQNASGKTRSELSTSGMQIIQNVSGTDTQIANLGYGPGTDSGGGTSNAPYYTFGTRLSGSVGNYSVAEGYSVIASGFSSHAEGSSTEATSLYSHAEGNDTTAINLGSHAEGRETTASGEYSHAEGYNTEAAGNYSHAEGSIAKATAIYSHAEGQRTKATNNSAHAEGSTCEATGRQSHAQNLGTKAAKAAQTVLGTYNIEDTSATTTHPQQITTDYGQYAVIIGNGTGDEDETYGPMYSNALTVDWSGNVEAAGDLTAVDINASGDISAAGNVMAVGMAGMVQMFAGLAATAPAGWLVCDGLAVSRTDYAELFAVIGTRFGSGDGSTTFNLPDLRGRSPLGTNAAALPNGANSNFSTRNLAATGGAETVKLTSGQSGVPAHSHGKGTLAVSPSAHKLKMQSNYAGSGSNRNIPISTASLSSNTFTDTHSITGSTADNTAADASSAHNNMHPFIGINFIICTGKF